MKCTCYERHATFISSEGIHVGRQELAHELADDACLVSKDEDARHHRRASDCGNAQCIKARTFIANRRLLIEQVGERAGHQAIQALPLEDHALHGILKRQATSAMERNRSAIEVIVHVAGHVVLAVNGDQLGCVLIEEVFGLLPVRLVLKATCDK